MKWKMMKVIDENSDEGDERLMSTTNKTWGRQQQEPEANTSSIFRILCDSWGCFFGSSPQDIISWWQQQTKFSLLFMSRFSSLASSPILLSLTRNAKDSKAKTGNNITRQQKWQKEERWERQTTSSLVFEILSKTDIKKRKPCLSYNVYRWRWRTLTVSTKTTFLFPSRSSWSSFS